MRMKYTELMAGIIFLSIGLVEILYKKGEVLSCYLYCCIFFVPPPQDFWIFDYDNFIFIFFKKRIYWIFFSLNRPHWADSVIESPCLSMCPRPLSTFKDIDNIFFKFLFVNFSILFLDYG